jgi:hypothetical protein
MQGDEECLILDKLLFDYYFIADSQFTCDNFVMFCGLPVLDSGRNIMFLSMYSNCITTADPYITIIIFFIGWLYFMYFLIDIFVFSVFNS